MPGSVRVHSQSRGQVTCSFLRLSGGVPPGKASVFWVGRGLSTHAGVRDITIPAAMHVQGRGKHQGGAR